MLNELAGTEREGWSKVNALEWTKKCSLGWWDLKQGQGENSPLLGGEVQGSDEAGVSEGHENWWPGLGRWQIGVVMEGATIEFPAGERWL